MENKEIENITAQITTSKIQTIIGNLAVENSRLLATNEVLEALIKQYEAEIAKLKETYELETSGKPENTEEATGHTVPKSVPNIRRGDRGSEAQEK